MKTQKIVYWIATGLLTVLMLFSASMYFFKHEMIKEAFTSFGYPTYIIYPLAVAKLLGLGVIVSNKGGALKEWAYAGFFFDFVLAFFAHYMISDGQQSLAVVGLLVLLASYFLGKKVRP